MCSFDVWDYFNASITSRDLQMSQTCLGWWGQRLGSVIFVLIYFLGLVLVLVFQLFFCFSFVLVCIILKFTATIVIACRPILMSRSRLMTYKCLSRVSAGEVNVSVSSQSWALTSHAHPCRVDNNQASTSRSSLDVLLWTCYILYPSGAVSYLAACG